MINKLYHPGNQLSRRRQQNQEKLFVEWRRQKSSLRRNDGLRWKEHIAETKADEQRITSHPLSARPRAGRMLRNVCFRTHVIPPANSNFYPGRRFHGTTAPFCFEACAPTGCGSAARLHAHGENRPLRRTFSTTLDASFRSQQTDLESSKRPESISAKKSLPPTNCK